MPRFTRGWLRAVVAAAAGALALVGASQAAAERPPDASFEDHGVDELICGFPLRSDLRADSVFRFVPGGAPHDLLFPTTLTIDLRNLLSGATATLRDAEPTRFASSGEAFTFTGNALITKGPFPMARLNGSTTVDLNTFRITRFRGMQEAVNLCGLVEATARDGSPRTTPAPWDAGANPLAAMDRAGLVPNVFAPAEHIHAHLDIFVDGEAVPVPGGAGVVAPFDAGGQDIQSAWNAMAPVHTHKFDGILHVHTHLPARFTLGDFFDVWRVRLTDRCIGAHCGAPLRAYVNGIVASGSPRNLVIRPRDEIALVSGTPPATIPSTYVFPPDLPPDFGYPG